MSVIFQRPARLTRRPRRRPGEKSIEVTFTVPASDLLSWDREATAEGVTRSHFLFEGAQRLARLTYEAREQDLMPVPARVTTTQLQILAGAAKSQGLTLDQWINHALMNAAASPIWEGEEAPIPDKISQRAA